MFWALYEISAIKSRHAICYVFGIILLSTMQFEHNVIIWNRIIKERIMIYLKIMLIHVLLVTVTIIQNKSFTKPLYFQCCEQRTYGKHRVLFILTQGIKKMKLKCKHKDQIRWGHALHRHIAHGPCMKYGMVFPKPKCVSWSKLQSVFSCIENLSLIDQL